MYTGGPTVVAGAWRGQAGATRGMGRGRALGTAAWVREDEGDPNLLCELSSDHQNGAGSYQRWGFVHWWSCCSGRSLAWVSWGHAGNGARQGIGYSRDAAGAGRREGDPNLQCELSSDRQNGGDSAMYLCRKYFPSPEAPCQKSGKERFFTCSKGVS